MEMEKSNNQVRISKHRIIVILIAGIALAFIAFNKVGVNIAHYEGNKLVYKGNYYTQCYAHYDASDKKIGFIKYPSDGIYALENDNTNDYLYVTKFTDQYLFI